ncbi:putative ran guanine nucleotide release factor [Hordeum vulgare]|nr:putative ran guanine nucleotide release factor [Hordeum vulgare]
MAGESSTRRQLFGGAISTAFPVWFQDVSNIREVPDHQEVLVDPARDESLIFELLDLKGEVEDGGSALWRTSAHQLLVPCNLTGTQLHSQCHVPCPHVLPPSSSCLQFALAIIF